MRIILAAVGKMKHQSPYLEALSDFQKRTKWDISIKEVEEKRPLASQELKEKEAELLLNSLPSDAIIIALDEQGVQKTSPEFATLLKQYEDKGTRTLAFLIGGVAGHGTLIHQKAHMLLSLGKMTWPHMLVRLLLMEQIYRAQTILTGHPYHKE
jgi:23S rRNA (pseudouridine1915-N3)-methyltransferase